MCQALGKQTQVDTLPKEREIITVACVCVCSKEVNGMMQRYNGTSPS